MAVYASQLPQYGNRPGLFKKVSTEDLKEMLITTKGISGDKDRKTFRTLTAPLHGINIFIAAFYDSEELGEADKCSSNLEFPDWPHEAEIAYFSRHVLLKVTVKPFLEAQTLGVLMIDIVPQVLNIAFVRALLIGKDNVSIVAERSAESC